MVKNKNERHTCETCGKRSRSCQNVMKGNIGQKWACKDCRPIGPDNMSPFPSLASTYEEKHPTKVVADASIKTTKDAEARASAIMKAYGSDYDKLTVADKPMLLQLKQKCPAKDCRNLPPHHHGTKDCLCRSCKPGILKDIERLMQNWGR